MGQLLQKLQWKLLLYFLHPGQPAHPTHGLGSEPLHTWVCQSQALSSVRVGAVQQTAPCSARVDHAVTPNVMQACYREEGGKWSA